MPNIFTPMQLGPLELPNRLVMAPLTRARAGTSHIPNTLIAEYYAQRAAAALIITEATMVAADGCAFVGESGLFNDACVDGWRLVTNAVHNKGGRIVVQLWHPGRAAHSSLNGGIQPISSTEQPIRGSTIRTPEGEKAYETPRRLAREELPGIVDLFAKAASRAQAAGFDGVQVHGAHGYLLDQFLRDGTNDRTDDYGGSLVNRARLLLETTDAVSQAIGADRVSVRLSPLVGYNDITDSAPEALVEYLAREFDSRRIAFLEVRHADHSMPSEQRLAKIARQHFRGPLMLNGGFSKEQADAAIGSGSADLIAMGRAYVANPDLVARFARSSPLNEMDPNTLYSPGAAGYTDYPSL